MKNLRLHIRTMPVMALMAALPAISATTAALVASGAAQAATAQWGTMPNGYGLCLDDTGYSMAGGTQMQVWTCNGKATQNWHIYESMGSPPIAVMLQVQQSGLCLDEYQQTGPKVIQWPCNPDDRAQWWTIDENGHGAYQFSNAGAMFSAAVAGAKVNTGNFIVPNADPSDSWGLPPFAHP